MFNTCKSDGKWCPCIGCVPNTNLIPFDLCPPSNKLSLWVRSLKQKVLAHSYQSIDGTCMTWQIFDQKLCQMDDASFHHCMQCQFFNF
jgi:hypothetical protein